MSGKKHVLFYLDEERRERLSCDDLQWILERGSPKSHRPGKDSGYRGTSFVCTHKKYLKFSGTPKAKALYNALPDQFLEFRVILDQLGIEEFRAWLERRAKSRRGQRSCFRRSGRNSEQKFATGFSRSGARVGAAHRGRGRVRRKEHIAARSKFGGAKDRGRKRR